MKSDYRIMDLLNRYHLYLYSLGYKIQSVDDTHCSITDYINSVEKIAELENKTIEEIAENIGEIFDTFSEGGGKNNLLPNNDNNRILKGLEHFKEFIMHCNKH